MPRRNKWGAERRQHSKGLKRPRGWHRKASSRDQRLATKWLLEQQLDAQRRAA